MSYKSFGKENLEKVKKIERIDELLVQLNKCWVAPLNKDPYTNRYFYELIVSLLETLSLEISSELNKEELVIDEDFRGKIKEILTKSPIFISRYDDSMSGKQRKIVIKSENWDLLKVELYNYDRKVRSWVNNKLKVALYGDNVDVTEIDEEGNIVGMDNDDDD